MDKSAATRHEQHQYGDIIGLPHHVSASHPPMPMRDRAAQFAPFAALTGHEAAIRETARLTEERMELSEDVQAMLNERLRLLGELLDAHPEITVTYFQPDERKPGGAYVQATGRIKKIDAAEKTLVLYGGTSIPIGDVTALEGALFRTIEDDA